MKATEAKLLKFLKTSPQFMIPIYQRSYSWSEKECQQLWDDIIRAGQNENVNAHFIGSIVYIEKGLYQVSSQSPILVIDGQQRLTTITLLLSALIEKLSTLPVENQEIIDGFSPKKLKNYYLCNPEEDGEKYYKLILSKTDKDSLISIVNGKEMPKNFSNRIKNNFEFFKEQIAKNSDKLEILCKGIAKLIIVDISLSNDQDNPQLIFESMNSTGKELTQADLIRNYVLMGLDIKQQTELYENYWRPMEIDFGQEFYTTDFDSFIRHYLTVKTGSIPRKSEVYDSFKKYSADSILNDSIDMSSIVKDIRKFAKYYCNMTLKQEDDLELRFAFNDIKELRVDVAYPMLLEMYEDYENQIISKNDFLEILRLVESYVFRRHICAIPTNSLNKTFSSFLKAINKDNYLENIKAKFLMLRSYRRFPSDEEFSRALKTRDLYNNSRRSFWFKKIENFNRKEFVEINEYTIEHILPQNPNLSKEWIHMLGENWQQVQETWLHTIGNLTLTGYNSEYSDKPFISKRDREDGFKDSPIKMNQSLRNIEKWDEDAIKRRANELIDIALKVWGSPALPNDVLDKYRQKPDIKTAYSIDDHPYLSMSNASYSKEVRELFEALRKKIIAIDPVVNEEILKRYIAYKAETNFVDIVPLSKNLKLTLNMPFSDINDPKGICMDVTDLGRWGNGDIQVTLSNVEDIPYIMGLVRQSFNRQMGEERIEQEE